MEHTPDNGRPSFSEVEGKVRDDLSMLREAAERRRDELLSMWNQLVQEHPVGMVGAAFGIGLALSGALVSRTTMKAVWFGARLYLKGLVRDLVGKAAGELLNVQGNAGPAFEG